MTGRFQLRISSIRFRRWLPRLLALSLGFGSVTAFGQAPATPPASPMPMLKEPVKEAVPEKTVSFVFDEKPWKSVLDWFAKESGLVFYSTSGGMPQGSVTIKTDPNRKYTLSQVVDLLNESLAPQNYIIVRRSQTFTVLPADKPIPKDLLPKISIEELSHKGDTEMVEVTYTLKMLLADDILPQLLKLKGTFGEINSLGSNTVVIADTARNVRLILKYLQVVEDDKSNDAVTYQCKFIRAGTVAEKLKELLTDSSTQVTSSAASPQYGYGYGGYSGGGGYYPPPDSRGRDNRSSSSTVSQRFKSVQISVIESTNTILITGPSDKLAAAKTFLKEIDVGLPGQKERIIGPVELRFYPVQAGTADAVAKTLQNNYKTSATIQITPLTASNQIMVYAPVADHFDIASLINGGAQQKSSTSLEIIPIVSFKDPKEIADQLKRLFPDTSGGLQIDYRTDPSPALIVKGTPQQIDDIRTAYKAIDNAGGTGSTGGMRAIPVENSNAAMVAEALADLIRKTRGNPVELKGVTPTTPSPAPTPAPMPKGNSQSGFGRGVQPVNFQISDPAQPAQPKVDPNKKPLTITVVGGQIVILCEDADTLEYATQLARLFVRDMSKPVDFRYEIIGLKNCAAEDAAKVIHELFNGPTQAQQGAGAAPGGRGGQGGGGGGFGGALGFLTQFAGIGASAPAAPAAGRIRVVADKQSNSLIVVKASDGDLAMMKLLLQKAIDAGQDVTSSNYPKTHYIALKYARAEEVKATLSEVFSNLTSARSRGGQQQMAFPFPIPGMQQPAAGGSSNAQLTMSIDDRSNALIVNCSDPIFEEVTKIVNVLDESAKNQNEVVRVVRLQGIDPALVEDAIRALSGQPGTTTRPGGTTGGGGLGSGSPFGGMFGGGGLGGGFGGGGTRGGITGGGTRGGGTGGTRGGGTRGGRLNRADISYDGGGGGRDFFDSRDMDVPSAASMIFDPESQSTSTGIQQIQYTQPAPVPQPPPMPMGGIAPPPAAPQDPNAPPPIVGGTTAAPIDPVTAESIPGTDLLLLRTKNQADMDAILRFIEFIRNPAKEAAVEVQLVRMKNQDASSVVNILNTLFSRVSIGAGSTTIVPGTSTGNRGGGGGFGGFGALFGGGFNNQQSASSGATTVGSIFMLPLPRFNSIMIAAPKSRLPDIMKEIERIDVPNDAVMSPTRFPLRKASAQNVAQQLQTFSTSRYGEAQGQNQIRVFFDAASNTVFVQASPADLKDIASLIEILDTAEPKIANELRVFRLKNAFSDEIAQVLYTAITSNSVNEALSNNATGAATTGIGGFGQQNLGGGLGTNLQQGGFGQQNQNRLGGAGGFGNTGTNANGTAGIATRTVSLMMYDADGKLVAETGVLQDVHITPDARINSIIISAPAKTMRLIEKLIDQLDVPAAAQSDVKVFTLKKADATTTATLIQQLFSRSTGTTGGGFNQGGFGGLFGGQGGLGGNANQQNQLRPIFNLTGDVSDGVNLIDLRLSVDVRTNSLIVGGSPSDLDTIRAIIAKLEDSESTQLMTKVYKLRNSAAADVQTALLTFMQSKLNADATVFNGGTFQTLNRQIFIQPEPVTNTLLIAVAPQYFPEIVGLIEKLDSPPPQVFVQVLIAEVQLRNAEEFGMEFGIQSPVLFARSQTGGASPGTPGFNFNTTNNAVQGSPGLPNTQANNPGIVGFQGLGNLGVGRSGATGVGGFVFSAASDTFNLLIRALKAQSRIDVLSKPQMLLTDNQVGFFQVGQRYPIPTNTTNTNAGVTQGVAYEDIGIVLRVTPRINPDGRVLMRVEPQITNPSPTLINVGNGQLATAFDTETVTTTVLASDGETVVIGGLIRRSDTKTENKIPVLGDIPYLGAAFRYRTQNKERREVIFIVTPHLVRSEADMARVGAVETSKMGWVTKDVINVNTYGAALLTGQNPYDLPPDVNCFAGPPNGGNFGAAPLPGGVLPDQGTMPGTPTPYPQPLPGGVLPDSSKASPPAPAAMPVARTASPFASTPAPLPTTVVQPAAGIFQKPAEIWPQDAAQPQPAPVPAKPREGQAWGVFKR